MNKKACLLASVSILLWGASPAVSKLALGRLSGTQLLFASSAVAALFLFCLCCASGRLPALKALGPRSLLSVAGTGLLGTFLYYEAYYAGLRTLSAQQATVINYLWPVMTVVISGKLTRTHLSRRGSAALALSFLGVALTATGGSLSSLASMNLRGVLFSLLGAAFYGLFTSLNVGKKTDAAVALMVYYSACALASGLSLLLFGEPFVPGLSESVVILWNGVLGYGLAYLTWMVALRRGNTAVLSNLAYLTPVVSLFLIWLFLGEPIALASFLGLGIILGGVLLQSLPGGTLLRRRHALGSVH